nr:T9SS type A sorting domain-containing protein [Bacteroidota bacterium]
MPMDPPVTGTLNQNESIDVEITCNAYQLEPGTHEGTVIIESNDPDNPVVEIPVTFVVTQLADVTVTPDTLWFLTWNDMIEGKIVNISNQTASDITITEITEFGSNIFWILEPPAPSLPYVLTAGDELELTVVIPIPPSRGDFRDLLYDDMNITTEVGEHTVVVAWDSDLMSFSMTLTPDTLWFIDAGTIYMEQTVTVSNNSNMPFEVHEIQQNGTGANFGWYTGQISVTLPYFLMPGDEFTFDVNIDIPVDGSLVNLAYDSVAIYSDAGINYEMLVVDTDLISGMNVDYLSQPQIYPNPFTGHLTIDLSTYDGQRLSIDLIDMGGQLVASLCNNVLISGSEKLNWSSTSLRKGELETGIYFIRFTTGTDITLKKIIKVD